MAVATPAKSAALLELRSASLTLVAVVLKTTDLAVLAQELAERVAATPDLFDNDPVAVDLTRVREACEPIDFGALIALLRSHHLVPVAARGGNAEQMAAATAAGLAEAPDTPRGAQALLLTESIREVQLPAPPPLVIDKPLRSGQQVYARGGDLVVLALVELRRRSDRRRPHPRLCAAARPGASPARAATPRRASSRTCLEPQLISIAGIYRTSETAAALLGGRHAGQLDGEMRLVDAADKLVVRSPLKSQRLTSHQ